MTSAQQGLPEQLDVACLLRALDLIVWQADVVTMRMLFVGGRAVSVLGYPPERWLDEPTFWEAHAHPDEYPLTRELCRSVVTTGHEATCVHRMFSASGAARWFRTTIRPLGPARPGARYLFGVMMDITERVTTEPLLKQEDVRLRLMLAQIPAVIYTLDLSLRFTSGFGAGLAALGLPPDQTLVTVSLLEYFHTSDPDYPVVQAHLRASQGEAVDVEISWLKRSYQLHVEPLRDEEGIIVGTIGVALDITARKRAEEERDRLLSAEREARAAAERAVRNRDDFLSVASHELRTPVTSLHLVIQSLLRGLREGAPAVPIQMLSIAEQQSRHLNELIEQLLDVSRLQAGRFTLELEDTDLSAEARAVAWRLAPATDQARAQVHVRADRPVSGRWDRLRIQQMLTNILSNALTYGAGKPVEVSVELAGEDLARITVRDQGIGIDAERLPYLFERFERGATGHHYGGLGLGLFLVHEIVTAHGGVIHVESELGRGSTFTVELPTRGPPPPGPPTAKEGRQE